MMISLAYLTSAPLPPPDTVRLAGRLGYGAVGLRILPSAPGGAFSPLIEDPALLQATVTACRETGVGVLDVEIVRLEPDFRAADFAGFLDVCGTLGARAVLVASDDPERGRLIEHYAAFCAAAAPYGLTADLEFMPWMAVRNCRDAAAIVDAAGQPNGRVLPDALHVARSGTTDADLRALDPARVHYAQVCDAPAGSEWTREEMIFTARQERMLPGDGGIDLTGFVRALPPGIPISVEVPSERGKAAMGVEAWCAAAMARTQALLAGS